MDALTQAWCYQLFYKCDESNNGVGIKPCPSACTDIQDNCPKCTIDEYTGERTGCSKDWRQENKEVNIMSTDLSFKQDMINFQMDLSVVRGLEYYTGTVMEAETTDTSFWKSSRDANEGLIGIKCTDNKAAIIEKNSETDLVSRNAEFQNLVRSILDITLSNFSDKDEMNKQSTDLINEAVAKIGENIVFKRYECIEGNVFSYIHNSAGEGLGKIGVLVDLDTELENANEVGKNMCMHCLLYTSDAADE